MAFYLLFGIHGHQPVGNFDHVFKRAFEHSYEPFLKVLYQFPSIKVTVHYTGPLYEWMERNRPDVLELLEELVERGQVEIVISGFYEPVLALLRERDRQGQIEMAREYVRKRFSTEPKGLWLTERVFEADVLPTLVKLGIKYVVVDDVHFLYAGLDRDELFGYYLTEWNGKPIALFPIDQKLRYLIPFRPIEEVFSYFEEIKERGGEAGIIFDDAEKFGLWPGTYEWVYKKEWLRNFFSRLIKSDVKTVFFYEFMEKKKPLGRIYLPSASYFEMGEWSLPAKKALEFERLIRELRERGEFERFRNFLRGGIYRNFLVKYEEANRMHKKMLFLSARIARMKDGQKKRELQRHLYRAQCNDAYWHGVFGGLYLPHLRNEVYRNLLKVEKGLNRSYYQYKDMDGDGEKEVYIKEGDLVLLILPHRGGGLYEFSSLSKEYNFANTLMRRYEHYHEGIVFEESRTDGEAPPSIHEIGKRLDSSLRKYLAYDDHLRGMFIERILEQGSSLHDVMYGKVMTSLSLCKMAYNYMKMGNEYYLYRGVEKDGFKLNISKVYFINSLNGLTVQYNLRGEGESDFLFVVELNIALPSGPSEKTSIYIDGGLKGNPLDEIEVGEGENILIDDAKIPIGIKIRGGKAKVWISPVYTISQSEAGFDLTYQETAIYLVFPIKGGEFSLMRGIEVEVNPKKGENNARA